MVIFITPLIGFVKRKMVRIEQIGMGVRIEDFGRKKNGKEFSTCWQPLGKFYIWMVPGDLKRNEWRKSFDINEIFKEALWLGTLLRNWTRFLDPARWRLSGRRVYPLNGGMMSSCRCSRAGIKGRFIPLIPGKKRSWICRSSGRSWISRTRWIWPL